MSKPMSKKHQKLLKLSVKAQECVDRESARKLIKKAEKIHSKLSAQLPFRLKMIIKQLLSFLTIYKLEKNILDLS